MSPAAPSSAAGRPLRADARRNYDRLLDAAREAVAQHGAETSLDDIARRAGVGSGTLYRHFPTRAALLSAVFHEQVEDLCREAARRLNDPDPAAALGAWLEAVVLHSIRYRGLATSLRSAWLAEGGDLTWCYTTMEGAAERLLNRAKEVGAIRADVPVSDLLRLVNGLALANLDVPDAEESAVRLLGYVLAGLSRS
ncbi:TetR/AcrR family transcriptional regulator [Cryptosporangium aurantiacum]|uniref:Transcriptional regulator, TetR family n=1 Tax=Cryptosporangium aurantiacum TaxID=134849 RepID=A0A1M7RIS4_9ACTN|nr:TetR/AcrR family transcriptional regulator [Cryptosporangium aurantiacum]SHN46096.1 transcriptional regulator, TetR family [Cryptosporangium aurantiacum]